MTDVMVWQGLTAIVNPLLTLNLFKSLAVRDGIVIILSKDGSPEVHPAKTLAAAMEIVNRFLAKHLLWTGTGGLELGEDPLGWAEAQSINFVFECLMLVNVGD